MWRECMWDDDQALVGGSRRDLAIEDAGMAVAADQHRAPGSLLHKEPRRSERRASAVTGRYTTAADAVSEANRPMVHLEQPPRDGRTCDIYLPESM